MKKDFTTEYRSNDNTPAGFYNFVEMDGISLMVGGPYPSRIRARIEGNRMQSVDLDDAVAA